MRITPVTAWPPRRTMADLRTMNNNEQATLTISQLDVARP